MKYVCMFSVADLAWARLGSCLTENQRADRPEEERESSLFLAGGNKWNSIRTRAQFPQSLHRRRNQPKR